MTYQIQKKTKIVVGVSGWCDSMYLLSYLRNNAHIADLYEIIVCICHHHTRPDIEKEIETIFSVVENLSHYVFHYTKKKTDEQSLRTRRHECFVSVCQAVGAKTIALWHHLNDRLETTLLNIKRGAWLVWWLWLKERTPHWMDNALTIWRPLLFHTKTKIRDLCVQQHIQYHDDPTNGDATLSQRNKLRQPVSDFFSDDTHVSEMISLYERREKLAETTFSFQSLVWHALWWASDYRLVKGERRNIQTHDVRLLMGHLWSTYNTTIWQLEEFVSFLRSSSGGYLYHNGWYWWVAHDRVYVIQAPRWFWLQCSVVWERERPLRFLSKQKVPVFWRYVICLKKENWRVVSYDAEGGSW